MNTTLSEFAAQYVCTGAHNDLVHAEFTSAAWADPLLAEHRRYIEVNHLGFGDPAFHYLWRLVLTAAADRFQHVRCLEIGVYKGQVLSLWALLAVHGGLTVDLHAVTPLSGHPKPGRITQVIRSLLSAKFREEMRNGNFYADEDYEACIRRPFEHFHLNLQAVSLWRGLSTSPAVLTQVPGSFHLVYVDGDHTYSGACADILNFAPRVTPGGWLVMDDAGADLPGSTFWKGHESVSRACLLLPGLGFRCILNVGHNRVFERTRAEG